MTASRRVPKMETNLLSSPRSREQARGRLPGLASREAGQPPAERPLWSQAGPRAGRHPRITSELAPASKAHAWTFQIFPLLCLTFPTQLFPSTPTFLLTLSFHSCSKTNNPGQMCQLAPGKGSLQREPCTHCTGVAMGRMTHRRAKISGCSGGAETGSLDSDSSQPGPTPRAGPSLGPHPESLPGKSLDAPVTRSQTGIKSAMFRGGRRVVGS